MTAPEADSADWQRGYRECSDRVRAALGDDSAAQKITQVRDWAQDRLRAWGTSCAASRAVTEMLAILDAAPEPAERTWLDDCRTDMFPGEPYFARVTHLPTGFTAEAGGRTPEAARHAAQADLGGQLIARRKITVNDARRAHGLKPWPQDASADEPPADLASEARAL